MRIKKNDNVVVLTGRDKGKNGNIIEVFPKKGKVRVEGVNIITKHKKPSKRGEKGSIVKVEALISASNVMLLFKGKPTRIGYKIEEGKKVRIARSTGEVID